MRTWAVYVALGWAILTSLYGMGQALTPKPRCDVYKPVLERMHPDYRVHEGRKWKM